MIKCLKRWIENLFWIGTILGIWARFIEPKLLKISYLNLSLPLSGSCPLKVVQISDLHFNKESSIKFVNKILNAISNFSPDLIVITGDFLCYGRSEHPELLDNFLKSLKAAKGVYAILGNHDFEKSLTINEKGDYDIQQNDITPFLKGVQRVFKAPILTGKVSQRALQSKPSQLLCRQLEKHSIRLLNNETVQIENTLNLTGLGEYMAGQTLPELAFRNYQNDLPGIALVHNPDAFPLLETSPCHLVLSGHTHGAQINLPWFKKRFCRLENSRFLSGLFQENNKSLFVSRGLGSVFPLRFNAIPEILCLTVNTK